MTQTLVFKSPYRAGLLGHNTTHLQVELSANVPPGHFSTQRKVRLSAKELAGQFATQNEVELSPQAVHLEQLATHCLVLFYPKVPLGHRYTQILVIF